MSSRYSRKRKSELDRDTSAKNESYDSPNKKRDTRSRAKKTESGESNGKNEESISIEETNRIRAELGLAPLDLDEPSTTEESVTETQPGETLFKEDGVEIVHKPSKNWSDTKSEEKIREKLEIQKQKHKIFSKLITTGKGLADDSDEEEGVDDWWEKAKARAQKVAQSLDDIDQTAEAEGIALKQKLEKKQKNGSSKHKDVTTAGLIVGHSKEAFQSGTETILVLEDKDVLDDNEGEVLINPNLVENERHKKNVELRKRKSNYKPYEEDEVDEFGEVKKRSVLSKYDEEENDKKRKEEFRLDESGGYELDREAQELEMKRRLMMANKKFESLESTKYVPAREFYTEEEMLSFRKPKKKSDKIRKRKALKASDLAVAEETEEEKAKKAARLAARRREQNGPSAQSKTVDSNGQEASKATADTEMEDGEVKDVDVKPVISKWKEGTGASVDLQRIRSLASKLQNDEEEEEDSDNDDFGVGVNLGGVIVDDEAEDELQNALARTRALKQAAADAKAGGSSAKQVHDLLTNYGVKQEPEDEIMPMADESDRRGIIIDSTDEQYKMIGDIVTFGLAGNRDDDVDYSELLEEHKKITAQQIKQMEAKQEHSDIDSDTESQSDIRTQKLARRVDDNSDMELDDLDQEVNEKPMWKTVGEEEPGPSDSRSNERHGTQKRNLRKRNEEPEDVYGADYQNVLGEERDVTKGVGAMLRLAAEKGYLENANKNSSSGRLRHLESKRYARVEQGKMDIEDKYVKKLERMGTTGSGPIRPFADKRDYTPNVEISYADNKGRLMEGKEAFRVMSWKFHGKKPGKKQIEKRQAQLDKKEVMKKMNSYDTPLGTLQKQRKKQEQLQLPYLLLSGANKDDIGAPLQKD
ncbi:hypothetical protein M3Y95_00232100 [Aphelenchoides besseyi]|nr:hypothetical protein M3Y95_00232100 [Aphelenchoides besseyi]